LVHDLITASGEGSVALVCGGWVSGDELAGQCTVLTASRNDKVRQLLGAFPEMNVLQARPVAGHGTGPRASRGRKMTAWSALPTRRSASMSPTPAQPTGTG
jgi:hypothetical protein